MANASVSMAPSAWRRNKITRRDFATDNCGRTGEDRMRQRITASTALVAACIGAVLALQGCAHPAPAPEKPAKAPVAPLSVAVDYYKLANGLRVVLSEDHSVPVATVGVYYNIGFRLEPKERTGFAHLFEHLMFQGSKNLAKGQFFKLVQGLGG